MSTNKNQGGTTKTIILTGDPVSTQSIYRYACRGSFPTMYMDAKGKNLKEAYMWEAKGQWKEAPHDGPIALTLKFFHKAHRKCDVDNFNKLVLDALTGIVWKDDSQITELHIYKDFDKEYPRVEVYIHR